MIAAAQALEQRQVRHDGQPDCDMVDLLARYAKPVPRYTSYPTAPHFSKDVGPSTYRTWLAAIPEASPASLYVHVPFCDRLCWYCGCNTKATQRYEPVADYLGTLLREIELVRGALSAPPSVTHVHWGGGSPSILSPTDIARLAASLRRAFPIRNDAEFAVEVDPRNLDAEKIAAFAGSGVNRVSIGVQDFSEAVQAAINRMQSYATTADVITRFRQAGVASINVDLVYGLPRQTQASLSETIDQVIDLAPDRIAFFGYAHIPSRLPHQRLIPDDSLPDAPERLQQSTLAARRLLESGYVRIGLDHFARPDDKLASGRVRRNFQGYTTDVAHSLIGLGASAIGSFAQGYVQNAVALGDYRRRIEAGEFAVAKGRALTADDMARGWLIEQLLCELKFTAAELRDRFSAVAEPIIAEAQAYLRDDRDAFTTPVGTDGSFTVTERGRPFLRSVCARFDAYLSSGGTHSAGV